MRRRLAPLAAALWLLLGAGSAPAAEPLEIRLPAAALRALARPEGGRASELDDAVRRANPWASRVWSSTDRKRFRVVLARPDGTEVRLEAERAAAQRLAAGTTAGVESLLKLPAGYALTSSRATPEGLLLVAEAAPPSAEVGAPPPEEAPLGLLATLREKTGATLRLLGAHRYQVPSEGGLNPDNALLELPRHTTEGEVRLDVSLDLDRLTLWAKPRARWTRDQWEDGDREGDSESDGDVLLLEGGAKVRFADALFVSFGRENLQWGPAQLFNPSNPFFRDNGRENPVREIPGMDFARAVWLPAPGWTLSWITNTGPGERDDTGQDWHPSHALKLDYLGAEASGALLGHTGPDAQSTVHAHVQWTASDALLLYGEGSVSRGTRVQYPTDQGAGLEASHQGDSRLYPFVLVGGGYTLELGPTLSVEYAYNAEGYDDEEARELFSLLRGLGQWAQAGGPSLDVDASSNGPPLLRKNYLFLQYLQTEIADRLNLILRWTQNLDDRSALGTGFAEWSLSDRWRLFGFGTAGTGGNRDEFGSFVRWSAVGGVEFSAF